MDLERFVREFGFHHINIKRDYYNRPNINYPGVESYYNDTNEIIEMEIGRRELERLADYVQHAEGYMTKDREEHYLRRQYPGLKDAYDKYKMLLELYK